jgi:hypothetical protein
MGNCCRGQVDEVFMDMAMLLDDLGRHDREVEYEMVQGDRQALANDPDSHAVHGGRSAGREDLLAACSRSLSRLEAARKALFSRMRRGRLVPRRRAQAAMSPQAK